MPHEDIWMHALATTISVVAVSKLAFGAPHSVVGC